MNNIRIEPVQDDVVKLVFDQEGSSANVFNRAMLLELGQALDDLEKRESLKGVILVSAKDAIFIAGLDLKELGGDLNETSLLEMVRLGQQTFNRIAELKAVTVAAIHGAALGGGCEITLACDYRIASPDRATAIGLPETSLGILPAWGGSTRLPRLIGLPAALDIILNGRKLAGRPAQKRGLVDALAPREHFQRIALDLIRKGKPKPASHFLTNNPVSAGLIKRKAAHMVAAKTRGHYPAIPKALDVVVNGLKMSASDALQLEEKAVAELARTEAAANLLRIFFMQDRAKRLRMDKLTKWHSPAKSGKNVPSWTTRSCMVIGAGVMGAGIAQWLSARGANVLLKDVGPEPLLKGMAHAAKSYKEGVKRYLFTAAEARRAMERIVPVVGNVPFANVGWVIEAVVENMDVKKKVFAELDELLPEDAILASNTSGLSITELGRSTKRPDRVIGLHFFNPVHKMQLVEIVVGEDTSAEVIDSSIRMMQKIGKLPVIVKDSPGFLVNRILMPYLSEAGELYATGARAADIDGCMLDFGMPMGPLRLLDEVGIDVADHVARHLASCFGEQMPVPQLLNDMMKAGMLGRKTGAGFYRYDGRRERENEDAAKLVKAGAASGYSREQLQKRMVLLMVNEAAKCVQEHIVATADDVDFAMIMGTGFAPFRGGPLRLLDHRGAVPVVNDLLALASLETKFTPCTLLRDMVNSDALLTTQGGDA